MKNLLLFIFMCILSHTTKAQSFGVEADNYSGVYGVVFNPANVTDSRLKADINLFSSDVFLGNDYVGITLSNITKALKDDFKFQTDLERLPTERNDFLAQVNILGPSFMFNLTKKSSIAFTTRVRSLININNINGELLENVLDQFESEANTDFNFDMKSLNTTSHVWGEVGVTYGRVLLDKNQNFIKGGATLKYILGAGIAQGNANNLSGNYNVNQDLLTTTGDFSYSNTVDDDKKYSFNDLSSGVGADIGIVYEWRPKFNELDKKQNNYKGLHKYKLKIGVSVTDIGSVTYKDVTTTIYDLNASVSPNSSDNDFEDELDTNYSNTKAVSDIKVKLPTTVRINADYSFSKKIFTSLNYTHSLNTSEEYFANRTPNIFSVTPRYESRAISVYLPINFSEFKGTSFGFGVRLGIFMIGSGTLISNLISNDDAKSLNIYTGIKIPIYQRSKLKKVKKKSVSAPVFVKPESNIEN
jgi:hypothetical protein